MGAKALKELLAVYDWVCQPREGLAPACKNKRWFHIKEHDGEPAYSHSYHAVGHFAEGRAFAIEGQEEFWIGPNGERVD